jgi:hypothetical protein
MNLSEGNNFNTKGNFLECKNIFSGVMTIPCKSKIKIHCILLYLKNYVTVFSSVFQASYRNEKETKKKGQTNTHKIVYDPSFRFRILAEQYSFLFQNRCKKGFLN